MKSSEQEEQSRAVDLRAGHSVCGRATGQLLAEHFSSLERMAAAKGGAYRSAGVGPKVAASIAEFFSEPAI